MKPKQLKTRLQKGRPMIAVTIRMPVDVVADLKRIAPLLGFSGYQALLKTYVGQGLRHDLERLDDDKVTALVSSLKKRGVADDVISDALNDVDETDTMRTQYDFSKGVRGRHHQAYQQGSNVVLLEPDLAEIFKDSESVNRALRMLVDLAGKEVHGGVSHP